MQVWTYLAVLKCLSIPPRKPEESKFASLREEKKKKERKKEGEEKGNVESQILGLCSFRSVVDFKGTSGANEESADLSGQTHCAQRDTHTCTHTYTLPDCRNLTQ